MRAPVRVRWLVVGGVVVLLGLGAVLAIRSALDPLLLKTVAESRLSSALGQPVRIGTVHVSLFPSPGVTGTDISVGAGPQAGGWLDIASVRLFPRLSTIFSRPIVIDRVEIDRLALHVLRDASGRWVLPLPGGSSTGGTGTAPTSEAARLDVAEVTLKNGRLMLTESRTDGRAGTSQVAPIQDLDATLHRTADTTRLDDLTASVGRSKVAGSGEYGPQGLQLSLRWTALRAADLPMVFALLGTSAPAGLAIEGRSPLTLELRVDANGHVSAAGRIGADRAALGTFTMTALQSPVSFASNHLTFSPLSFRAYSGTGQGRVAVNVASSPASWGLNADLRRVDIDRFVSDNTTAKGKLSGTATLEARLNGMARAPVDRSVTGTVGVAIANGVIRDFPLVSALYSALKLGGGDKDLHFQSLSATFSVANARATTTDLFARTGELTMTAAGTIGFDQTMAMTGTATFSAARSEAFVHSIRELSALKNQNGEIAVPFTVSGSVAAPRFSIDVAGLVRHGLENELKRRLGDRLRDLIKKK